MKLADWQRCPKCNQYTIPELTKITTAVVCQNPDCLKQFPVKDGLLIPVGCEEVKEV